MRREGDCILRQSHTGTSKVCACSAQWSSQCQWSGCDETVLLFSREQLSAVIIRTLMWAHVLRYFSALFSPTQFLCFTYKQHALILLVQPSHTLRAASARARDIAAVPEHCHWPFTDAVVLARARLLGPPRRDVEREGWGLERCGLVWRTRRKSREGSR